MNSKGSGMVDNTPYNSKSDADSDMIENLLNKQITADLTELIEKYFLAKRDLVGKFQELKKLEKEAENYKKKYDKVLPKYEKLQKDFKEAEEELKELKKEKKELKKKLESADSRYSNLKENYTSIKKRVKEKIHELHKKIDEKERIISGFSEIREELDKYKYAYKVTYDSYKKIKQQFEKLLEEKDLIFKELGAKEEDIKNFKSEHKKLKTKYTKKKNKLNSLRTEFSKFKEKETKSELTNESKIHELKSELDTYKKQVDKLDKEKKDLISKFTSKLDKDKEHYSKVDEIITDFDKHYEKLLSNIPLGIVVMQANKVKFSNSFFRKLVNYNKKELDSLSKVLTKSSEQKLKSFLKNSKKSSVQVETKLRKKTKLYLEAEKINSDYSGRPAKVLIFRDITYKKSPNKAKSNIENLKKELEDKQVIVSKLQKVIDEKDEILEEVKKKRKDLNDKLERFGSSLAEKGPSLNNLIIVTDSEGYVSSLNSKTKEILGYNLKDFVDNDEGKEININSIAADEKEVAKFKGWLEEIKLNREPLLNKIKVKNKQGEISEFLIQMELILDVDSEPIGIIHILSEV